ncbi:MAG: hypothetical protein HY812_21545 [Planctomycetes bacterium]|nr:hypothetical protein [Planctomycetota bacterium]
MAKRQQAVEEIEEVAGAEEEAGPGGGLELGLVLATTLTLLAGLVTGLVELGVHYGAGPFK